VLLMSFLAVDSISQQQANPKSEHVPAAGQLACEAIPLPDEILPEELRDAREWKWVGFKTQSGADGRFALELRDARRWRSQISLLVVDSSAGAEEIWACGIKASDPCAYAILRGTRGELKLVISGSIPSPFCPGCSAQVEDTAFELPFEELWDENRFRASNLEPGQPFTFAIFSWNGKVSSDIARSKFTHPWCTVVGGGSVGFANLEPAMKRLMNTKLRDWPHPVLAWTVMLIGDGDEQRILKSRKL